MRLLARGALALAPGSTVFLCSRDIHRGEEALKKIKEEGDTKVEYVRQVAQPHACNQSPSVPYESKLEEASAVLVDGVIL